MKKFYATLAMALATVIGASAAPVIYAYQTWQHGNDNSVTGPIKFDPETDPIDVTLIADQSRLGQCYCGFYYNYKWYVQVTLPGTQSTIESFSTIDTETGERTPISLTSTKCIDLTYDYTTNNAYGIYKGNSALATLDINTGAVKKIGDFTDLAGNKFTMIALACDLDGQLYAVSTNDSFYKVNKTNGRVTLVGELGVDAAFDQSMAFDYSTGVLYWYNNGKYALYTIDTKTGKAKGINNILYNGEFDSLNTLMIPYINVAKGAPDRVTGRSATVSGTSVKLAWTLPTKDAQGNALTSLEGIKVLRDGTQVASLDATATEYTDNNVSEGGHDYKLVPFNAAGDGGVDTDPLHVVVGADVPAAVASFSAVPGDNKAVLSWTAPTKGLNGGSFDPAGLTGYVIKRRIYGSPDQTEIKISDPSQTSYEDTPGYGRYIYSIAAVNDKGEGAYTEAPTVLVKPADWILMGQGDAVAVVEDGKTYKFYDNGGEGNYTNNANDLLTIKPANPNSYIRVQFTEFEIDSFGDYLIIYNGLDETAPKIGEFNSEGGVPEAIKDLQATNDSGALTFHFTSDIMDRRLGWVATVTAVEAKANDLAAVSVRGEKFPTTNKLAEYFVKVTNKGRNVAKDYKVQLRDAEGKTLATVDGTELARNAATELKLQYTFTEAKNTTVSGYVLYDADEDVSNNSTAALALNIVPEGSELVTIGAASPDDVSVVPTTFLANQSVFEGIYYASDLGENAGKKIAMISFPYGTLESEFTNVPMRVWLGETEKANLEDGIIPVGQLTKVFEGTIDVKLDDEAMAFALQNEYKYNGKNLVVMIYKTGKGTNLDGVAFKGTYGKPESPLNTRFDNNDEVDDEEYTLDPEKTDETFGYAATSIVPDINVLFIPGAGVNDISVDGSASIKAADGAIIVSGNAGQALAVYAADGKAVYVGASVTDASVSVVPGVYIVRAGTTTAKVIVK